MKSTAILELMIRDHARLVKLVKNLEDRLKDDVPIKMKAFDDLEWAVEKHLFTEEKAIFTSYQPVNIIQGYKMVPELIKEHNEILNLLRIMRKDLVNSRQFDFEGFKQKLIDHKTFEEEQLYPKLDQELDASQKNIIISRIQEIVS